MRLDSMGVCGIRADTGVCGCASKASECVQKQLKEMEEARNRAEANLGEALVYERAARKGDASLAEALALWMEEAKQGQAALKKAKAQIAKLERRLEEAQAAVPHAGDGSCDQCGSVPAQQVSICRSCLEESSVEDC